MNLPLDQELLRSAAREGDFALERSRSIDAFAQLEYRVELAARRLQIPVNRDCLGRRVAALGKVKPCPALSKANAKKLVEWIARTELLLNQRAALVHSTMELGIFGGEWRASFANVVDRVSGQPTTMLFTLEQFRRLTTSVRAQQDELAELVSGIC